MAIKKMKQEEKTLLGIVSFVAIVAILLMLYQSGVEFGDVVGYAAKASGKTISRSTVKISCTDSDDGADLTIKGVTKGPASVASTSALEKYDSCKDSKTIIEYVCENGLLVSHEYFADAEDRDYRTTCTCEDGVCTNIVPVAKTTITPKISTTSITTQKAKKVPYCLDTDDGKDYYAKGTATTTAGATYTDTCCIGGESCGGYTDGRLKEYYCPSEQESPTMVYPEPPNGYACSDGAYVAACVDSDSGQERETYGAVTVTTLTAVKTFGDSCSSASYVKEYYCAGSTSTAASSAILLCSSGTSCVNGVCVAS